MMPDQRFHKKNVSDKGFTTRTITNIYKQISNALKKRGMLKLFKSFI